MDEKQTRYTWGFIIRVVLKASLLFASFNLLFAWSIPLPTLGKLSLYNTILPGRERLPYGENPSQSYNLSLNNLNAMFESHVITQTKNENEFRVLLIGDSSTWGILLHPEETLAGQINQGNYKTSKGQHIRAYNLGHPIMSLTKDLLLLDKALEYEPDFIIWLFTLESFLPQEQLYPPLVQHNPTRMRPLIKRYKLALDPNDSRFVELSFTDKTLIGQRRELADLLRLQLYGFPYAATEIDQYYPENYTLRQENFEEDYSWHHFEEPQELTENDLAFDVLQAGVTHVGEIPILLVNEPMFISQGTNSDIRYNFFYPRWAYDNYRTQLHQISKNNDWHLLDAWNSIPTTEFTDSAVHLTPHGSQQLSQLLIDKIQ